MVLAVPVPATAVVTSDVTAAFWNAQIRDTVTFLLSPPHCVMYQTVAQSIPGVTATAILFDTNEVDSYSGHSVVTNTSRYVAQVAGWYQLSGVVAYANSSATSYRFGTWFVNSTVLQGGGANETSVATVSNPLIDPPVREAFLNVGDFAELRAMQNSGGAINTSIGAGQNSMATIRWVHV